MAPYPGPVPPLSVVHRAASLLRGLGDFRSRIPSAGVSLDLQSKRFRPLTADDIPLIVVSRNEARLAPSFLAHYRTLGVTRFLWVDDASDDGTVELLTREPDVDLYTSNIRFKAASRGRLWRQMLVEKYGTGQWYVSVDADEYLIYRDHENFGLREVTEALAKRQIWHMPAPMIDMYPAGDVAAAGYDGTVPPWKIATHFDAGGYDIRPGVRSWKMRGGVRKRALDADLQLIKYPLLYWGPNTSLTGSIHTPSPSWRNYAPILGVLLHFKFFSDYEARFRETVSNGQHFRDGGYYADMLDLIPDTDMLKLDTDTSAPFTGAEDLYRRGFMADWKDGGNPRP